LNRDRAGKDCYRAGSTISVATDGLDDRAEDRSPATHGRIEQAVLELLDG